VGLRSRERRHAGVYQWDGAEEARAYADSLVPILRALSRSGSVSYRLYEDARLADHCDRGAAMTARPVILCDDGSPDSALAIEHAGRLFAGRPASCSLAGRARTHG